MFRFSRLMVVTAAIALAGCSFIEPEMIARLRALDPMTANPSDIVARVSLPEGLEVAPNGAVLEFTARRSDSDEVVSGWYPLQREDDVWRLAPEDAAAIRDIQMQMRMWENEAPEAAEGRVQMHVKGCALGTGPDPDASLSVDLSLDGGQRFRPFLRNMTAAEVVRVAGDGGDLRPC